MHVTSAKLKIGLLMCEPQKSIMTDFYLFLKIWTEDTGYSGRVHHLSTRSRSQIIGKQARQERTSCKGRRAVKLIRLNHAWKVIDGRDLIIWTGKRWFASSMIQSRQSRIRCSQRWFYTAMSWNILWKRQRRTANYYEDFDRDKAPLSDRRGCVNFKSACDYNDGAK